MILQAHCYSEGRKDIQQGIRIYQEWAATYPGDWTPWVNLANDYTQIGNYSAAIAAGKKALEIEPNRGINYSVLARAYMRANQFDSANAIGTEAVRRGKDSVGLHSTLFILAAAQDDENAVARETTWAAAHPDPCRVARRNCTSALSQNRA